MAKPVIVLGERLLMMTAWLIGLGFVKNVNHIGWWRQVINHLVNIMKVCKLVLFFFLLPAVWNGCANKEKNKKEFPPLGELRADSIVVPPVLLSVTRLFVANDMLVAYEQKKDTMFSFWSLPQCKYLFSAGCKGEGPDDFLMLDRTFVETDHGFKAFEIASNRIKEIRVDSTGNFSVNSTPLNTDGRGLNRFLFLKDSTYCFISDEEETEYTLLDKRGGMQYFSRYPQGLLSKEQNEINRFVYNKLTVSNPRGDKFAAFYAYIKLCRIYDNTGRLLAETLLDTPVYSYSGERVAFYRNFPCVDKDYIYILSISDEGQNILEIWDWSGIPVAHYLLDKDVRHIAVSSDYHKIYAIDDKQEGVIYVYDLLTELKKLRT